MGARESYDLAVETPVERLRIALRLHDEGVAMHRLTLRRRHPELRADEIEAKLQAWLAERPGAELGDGEGTPRAPIPPPTP
jgi:hypothetical protein